MNQPSGDGVTPLIKAALLPGNSSTLRVLLDAGADVDARAKDGMTVLSVAAVFGRVEEVAVLLKAGVRTDTGFDGITPLHLATGIIVAEAPDRTGTFEERVEKSSAIYRRNDQLFIPDFLSVTRLLVEAGADVNARTDLKDEAFEQFHSKTPLDLARMLGNMEVAAYLENIGAKTAVELED